MRLESLARFVLFAAATCFVACSAVKGDSGGDPDGGGATAADGAPLGPGVDGGAQDGATTVLTDFGTVSLSYADYGTAKAFTGFAQFQKTSGVVPSVAACQSETDGDCVAYVCGPTPPPVDSGAPTDAGVRVTQAGVVTLSGARIPAGTKLSPGADGKYPPLSLAGLDAWSGGESLVVSAAGGEVPAFSGNVIAPAPSVTLSAPAVSPTVKVDVDRSKPLSVSWTGAGAGTLTVSTTGTMTGGGSASVTCRFDASKGAGQMPAKLLSKLPAGTGSFGASISVTSEAKAGTYSVTIVASSSVKNAAGQVTLK